MCIFNDEPDTKPPPAPAPAPAKAPKMEKAVAQKRKSQTKKRQNRSGTRADLALNTGGAKSGLNTGG